MAVGKIYMIIVSKAKSINNISKTVEDMTAFFRNPREVIEIFPIIKLFFFIVFFLSNKYNYVNNLRL